MHTLVVANVVFIAFDAGALILGRPVLTAIWSTTYVACWCIGRWAARQPWS